MDRKVSRLSIILTIIAKDAKAFSRDMVWAGLTVLGLVAYVTMFWLLPNTVNETITVGVHHFDLEEVLGEYGENEEGLTVVEFDSPEDMEAAVAGEVEVWETDEGLYLRDKEAGDEKPENGDKVDVGIGIAFPEGFVLSAATGEKSTVNVYMDSSVPEEIRSAMSSFVREMAYGIRTAAEGGAIEEAMPVSWPDEETIILGEDRSGDQVPLRDKMRAMIAYFVLMIESFALAGLVATEVQARTVTALLVTPARVSDLLIAKGIFGTLLAFSQAVIVLALIGAFGGNTASLLVIMFLGAIMMAGIGLFTGAAGKDFMGTMYYGFLFLLPLAIPSFAVLYPGSASDWVKFLPSYGIVEALIGVTSYGDTFGEMLPKLAIPAVWVVVILGAGVVALKRKVQSL